MFGWLFQRREISRRSTATGTALEAGLGGFRRDFSCVSLRQAWILMGSRIVGAPRGYTLHSFAPSTSNAAAQVGAPEHPKNDSQGRQAL